MDYKTIRYPGHCAQMRLLMNDLKLNQDRATLKRILENAVPQTLQDVVIVYVAVTGRQDGELREENYVSKIYPQMIAGRLWSAIQVTTAAGIARRASTSCCSTPGRYRGFVRQEDFRLVDVLDNRFGRYYADGGTQGNLGPHGRRRPDRPAARAPRRRAMNDVLAKPRTRSRSTPAPGRRTAAGSTDPAAERIESDQPRDRQGHRAACSRPRPRNTSR